MWLKTTHVIYYSNHAGICVRHDARFQGRDADICKGFLVGVELFLVPELNLWSVQPRKKKLDRIKTSPQIYYPQRIAVDSYW